MLRIPIEQMRQLPGIDLRTESGTRHWSDLMLGCLDKMLPVPVPEKPWDLRGVEPWHIRKILDSGKGEKTLGKEEVTDLRAWRKWRDEVVDAEMRNTLSLHGLLMLVKRLADEERYRVEYFLANNWNMPGAELRDLLNVEGLYFVVRDRCRKLNRCAHDWREPRWKGI